MNSEATIGHSEPPSRVPATVWLRRWQVEEEGLTVRVGNAVEWRCVFPSSEVVALMAAAGVTLTAELDTYADEMASNVFHSVRGVVTGVHEVRTDGSQPTLISCDAVSISEMASIAAAPGFIVTVLPPATRGINLLATRA